MPTGIFTTLRVEAGELCHPEWHRRRLLHDAKLIVADYPILSTYVYEHQEQVFEAAKREAARSLADAPWMARLLFWAQGNMGHHRVELATAHRARWTSGSKPLRLILRPDPRPDTEIRVKWLERSAYRSVEAEGRAGGVDGILLHGDEDIREGTWFHIAAYFNGSWHSSAPGDRVIYGATRAAFLDAALRHGESIRECSLSFAELRRAKAVVALSSLLGGAPVCAIGEWSFPDSLRCYAERPWIQRL